jgi:CBS domain-containing protein
MSLARFTRKQVVLASCESTVADVAALMQARHVGAVVLTQGGQPMGIVTDRDLALRVVGAMLPGDTPVARVMSRELITARADDGLDEAFMTMRRAGVRRLPIVDGDGRMVGLVSLDDLLVLLAGELTTAAGVALDNRGP